MRDKIFWGGAAAMALVLALSNYLVLIPLGDFLTWAAFSYPLAFLVTDCVNRAAGPGCARKVVCAGFVCGLPLSFAAVYSGGETAAVAARIAFASGTAFAVAQFLDVAVFHRLRRAAWWLPPLASSAPASAADTFLFFFLAFGGGGLPWATLAAGDLAVKALMIFALLPPYRMLTFRLAAAR
ncbi:MAG: VUT family protein [Gammaproteobacteria bacterium]